MAVSTVSAGNATDTVARIVLDQVSKQIGQSFVIENRTGAGGTIGFASADKADPDGYTILLLTGSQGSAVALKSLPYDPLHDFVPVALFGLQPSVLVAAPSKGWTSVTELVAAKANPGALKFASAGLGSASHWAGERLRLAAGINVQHIPFRGPVDAFTEVMTGRVDFYYLDRARAAEHQGRQGGGAGGEHVETGADAAEYSDGSGSPAIPTRSICSGAIETKPCSMRHAYDADQATAQCR